MTRKPGTMKKRTLMYTLSQRQIPLENGWDVIVVGGGPAGCTAAIAAAREGARTLLIEATGCLGGRGTNGLMPVWEPFSDQEKLIYRGLAQQIFDAAKQGMAHVDPLALDGVPIDAERLKRVYDELVTAAGVTILFQTNLSAVDVSPAETVAAILVSHQAGLTAYRAKVYVDCTDTADLAVWAGAERLPEEPPVHRQPATVCFLLANVDVYGFHYDASMIAEDDPGNPLIQVVRTGKYPLIQESRIDRIALIGPGVVGVSVAHPGQADHARPEQASQAFVEGRHIAEQMRHVLAEAYPSAFANACLAATSAVSDIQPSRRILGDYILTTEDYYARSIFRDEMCRSSYGGDFPVGEESVQGRQDEIAKHRTRYNPGESYGIPYRCFTPKGLTNVLVAGQAISCDQFVQASVRAMPVCLAMGEAAGMAAAHAARLDNINVHDVDIEFLRQRLRAEGAYFL